VLSEDSKINSIPEHKIRGITKEKDFERQGDMWGDLKLQRKTFVIDPSSNSLSRYIKIVG